MSYLNKLVLLFAVSQTAIANVYTLKFDRVAAAGDPKTCATLVEATARELVAQTTAQIIDYGCSPDSYTSTAFSAIITFSSDAPFTDLTSTYRASFHSSAFYATRETCNETLELQKEFFTRATGLIPLAAYCMLDIGIAPRWETRIDALGTSVLKPETAGLHIYGPLLDEASVFEDYKAISQDYGIIVSDVGIARAGLGGDLGIRFFSTEPYLIDDYNKMKYESADACSAAAASVRLALKPAEKPAVIFCETYGKNLAVLHVTSLVKILDYKQHYRTDILPTSYPSLTTCQQASQKIGVSAPIYGAVCAGVGKDFRIHLFSRL